MFGLRFKKRKVTRRPKAVGAEQYQMHKEAARVIIVREIERLAPLCGVNPKRIAIRNTRRNWGSCSSLGNLNFNYKVALLPPCLRDYIIIHELCHLIHLHHKKEYWEQVAKFCPEYEERVRAVRQFEVLTRMNPVRLQALALEHRCAYCELDKSVVS